MRIICCDDDAEVGKQMECYLQEYFEKYNLTQPEYEYFGSGEELLRDERDAVSYTHLDAHVCCFFHPDQSLKFPRWMQVSRNHIRYCLS